MTKTEARKRAKYTLTHGFFQPGKGDRPVAGTGSLVYVYCPICKAKVEHDGYAWDSARKLQAELCELLVMHMAEDH